MNFKTVKIEKPEHVNVIIGQAHFIKTVEDLYEVLVNSMPSIKFGISFSEASGPCLVRFDGNDNELIELAKKNAMNVGAGHTFYIFIDNAYPINILNEVKNCREVARVFCATANPLEVIVAESEQGRGIIGVIDGFSPKGVEGEKEIEERKNLLRKFGYKR